MRLILIADTGLGVSPSGFCYHNGDWTPICMPLAGTYDDYGGIEAYTVNALHDLGFAEIRQHWVDPKVDDVHIHEASLKKNLTWDSMLNCVERNGAQLCYTRYTRKPSKRALGMFMVHEPVYQALAVSGLQYKGWELQSYGEQLDEALVALKESLALDPDSKWHQVRPDPFREIGFVGWDSTELVPLYKIAQAASNTEELMGEIRTFAGFDFSMRSLRSAYRPQPGKGSQSDERAVHRKLFDVCEGIFQAREQAEKDDNY